MSHTLRFLTAAVLAIAVAPAILIGQDLPTPEVQELLAAADLHYEDAREAIRANDQTAAAELFDQTLEMVYRTGSAELMNEYDFKVAATIQSESSGGRIQRMAIQSYERIIERGAGSPPVWNNLAKIYARMKRFDEAESLFVRAIEAGGEYETVFRQNYASYLEDQGRTTEAAEQYALVLVAYPGDDSANEAIVRTLVAERDAAGLTRYCWNQLERGQAARIARVATDVLPEISWGTSSEPPPWGWDGEYTSILASALAQGRPNPEKFLGSGPGKRLRELGGYSPAISGLIDLYRGVEEVDLLEPKRFVWWAERANDPFEEDRVRSPRDSFRDLVRSIGSHYRTRGRDRLAEAFFALSADLTHPLSEEFREADPDAVLEMAEMRFEVRDTLGLDSLLGTHHHLLFEDKAIAYMQRDTERIYQYQRALGTMYARLGRWGKAAVPGTANFHLEEAVRAAEEFNASDPEEPIRVSPELLRLRTIGLIEADRASEGVDFGLDYTKKLLEEGDQAGSHYLYAQMQHIDSTQTLTEEQHLRLETIEAEIIEAGRSKSSGARPDMERTRRLQYNPDRQ